MMWMCDCLNLLGAKYIESDPNYHKTFTLPNGDSVIVKDERWWYLELSGEGHDKLWELAWPRINQWRKDREAEEAAQAQREYEKAAAVMKRFIDWANLDGYEVFLDNRKCFESERFPSLAARTSTGRCEAHMDFDQKTGKVDYGFLWGGAVNTLIGFKRMAKKKYEFDLEREPSRQEVS
jgi:hypothetical protein